MDPVRPRTIVLGPAVLAIIFISNADSHPWQVRCPEVKNSSSGSFLTDLKGSSPWVGSIFTKVDIVCSSFLTVPPRPHKSVIPTPASFTQHFIPVNHPTPSP